MAKYDHLTKDELVRLLQARDRSARFGLVWEANEIDRDKAVNGDFVALDLVPEHSVGPAPWRNLIIEADNFDALRYLRMTHAGRVKCIYIDPPYNTGNRDFVYNDRFVDVNDTWRHSMWCEFMYQRLLLAKDLLREDGVIFVSINDNEVAALRLLMNKVYTNEKFVACLIWKSRQNKDNRNVTGVSIDHEYVMCYGGKLKGEKRDLSQYSNSDNDPNGPWTSGNMVGLATRTQRPNLHYDLIDPKTGINYGCPEKGWRYGRETMDGLIARGHVLWPKSKNGRPREKAFLKDLGATETGYSSVVGSGIFTRDGSNEVRRMFGGQEVFGFPKPSEFVQELIFQATADDKQAIILDFFAGSGTTAHAVMKLNAEDKGNRRFILVSNTEATTDDPTKNLCRDVCARRVQRVIEGYGETPGLDGDFAYLRCRRVPPGRLIEIEHSQVWTALQMIHRDTVEPYAQADFLTAGDEDAALIYVPRFTPKLVPALRKAVQACAAITLYSWQPETLRQHIRSGHVQHEAIPENLARRFGMKG